MRDRSPTGAGPPRGPGGPRGVPILVGLLAAFVLGALVYGLLAVRHIARVATPQAQAAAALRFELASAHLWANELLSGEPGVAPARVWSHLDAAAGQLSALLAGGRPDGDEVPPLTDPGLVALAEEARDLLGQAHTIYSEDVALAESGPVGERPLDGRHDVVTGVLLQRADRLQGALAGRLRGELRALRRGETGLLGAGLLLACLAGFLTVRIDRLRRRERAELDTAVAARRAAQAESALLATAVAQASEIVFVTDPEARIEYVNRAFTERLGWRSDEVVGQYAEVLRSHHHEGAFYEELFRDLQEGLPWRGSLHLKRRDGGAVAVEQAITPIRDGTGRICNLVVVARDVSREQALQAQMEHVQRLESLGVLAGGIAHDFNNILTAIMGNAALARAADGPDGPAAEPLQGIEEAAARAAELSRQMLAYAGKGRMELKPMSLTGLVEGMPRLLEVGLAPGVSLAFELAPDLPPVEADASRLRQVLMNLVLNGAEAAAPGPGRITVRTGTAHVGPEDLAGARIGSDLSEGNYVFLEVSDTGAGMDAATLKRLFEPFFTTKAEGRGLGMSAVLGIVRAHRGALLVASRPGEGSTFRLLLPPAPGTVPIPPAEPEEDTGWHGQGRVLVVDDEPGVRQVTCRMLEHLGFEPEAVADGLEAVERFRGAGGAFACVMLDLTMPGMDGAHTCEALRAIRADVPVLVFSGYGSDEQVRRVARGGRSGFVAKPFTTEQLRHRLRELLEAPEAAPEAAPQEPLTGT